MHVKSFHLEHPHPLTRWRRRSRLAALRSASAPALLCRSLELATGIIGSVKEMSACADRICGRLYVYVPMESHRTEPS